ncbi:hypothetical protein OE88DRAFT_1810044 [Heliocybe sulcata]|uniref:XPG-I domain-containing protein n=1 Tax=Heliocybe sulcata TaxID=5364 RepID=A0A5C3MW00_9AGAM|nr:hypothetical protein OE88DRAFT_1810044 [Heliocybe sulcata]
MDCVEELVTAFGFHHHTAPGEAEAELAELNRRGYIDAILTKDGDALVFGALQVLRSNPHSHTPHDGFLAYTSEAIQHSPLYPLSQGGLLLVAVLAGGDYDKTGLAKCGPRIAQKLAQYGLGDILYTAATTLSREGLIAYLPGWRDMLRFTLLSDPLGKLGQTYTSIASNIKDTFPNPDVICAYALPLTSFRSSSLSTVLPSSAPQPIDIAALTRLCERWFTWGSPTGIIQQFRDKVWPAVFARNLSEEVLRNEARRAGRPVSNHTGYTLHGNFTIKHYTLTSTFTVALGLSAYQVDYETSDLEAIVRSSVLGLRVDEGQAQLSATRTKCWVPALVLEEAFPALTHDFCSGRGLCH